MVNKHLKAIFELVKTNKGCGSSLRQLISNFKQHYSSLESLHLPSLLDSVLIYVLAQKIDSDTLCAFQMQQTSNTIPTLEHFLNYLSEKASALELNPKAESRLQTQRHTAHNTIIKKSNNSVCSFCKNGIHLLHKCFKFNAEDVRKRHDYVKQSHLCFNCLKGHKGLCQSNFKCSICGKRHNSLLHFSENSNKPSDPNLKKEVSSAAVQNYQEPMNIVAKPDNAFPVASSSKTLDKYPDLSSSASQTLVASSSPESIMLMATAIVDVASNSKRTSCRVLLDNASDKNFISADIVAQLDAPVRLCNWEVGGVGGTATTVQKTVELKVFSRYCSHQFSTTFGVLPKISDITPNSTFRKQSLRWPSFVKLADPTFNVADKVDMLLGIELFYQLFGKEKIELGPEKPILQETLLGWIVVGPLKIPYCPGRKHKCHFTTSNPSALH